mgnify:CR=1 FL=1
MTETPKCPYCGAEMLRTDNITTACMSSRYRCRECGSAAPQVNELDWAKFLDVPEIAREAALHRAEPENRLLTVNEATGSEDPVWLETRKRKTLMITDVCIATDYHYAEVYTIGRGIPYLILLDSYGKLWRCWPRKPTPEQMWNEKWED